MSLSNGSVGMTPGFENERVIMHEPGRIETCELYATCERPCLIHGDETYAAGWGYTRMCPVIAVMRLAQEYGGYVADWQVAETFLVTLGEARALLEYIEKGNSGRPDL